MPNTLAMMNQFPLPEGREPIGPMFDMGKEDATKQYMEGDLRYFEWHPSPYDYRLCDLAGWGHLLSDTIDASTERLILPGGIRSSSNVLPGIEAFEGEKRTIIDFITDYTKKVVNEYGAFDTNLTLDTVGVGRGNEQIIILPPHNLTSDRDDVAMWVNQLHTDLEDVLAQDPRAAELVKAFEGGMIEAFEAGMLDI